MEKYISSSITKNIFNSVQVAKDLNLGIEISRLPDFINVDTDLNGIIKTIKSSLKDFNNKITMHGMFFDLSIASQDRAIRDLSRKRFYQSFQVAKEINANTLVFHSGFKGMKHKISQERFKEASIKFWQEFVKEFEDAGITAVIENVLEPDPTLVLDILTGVNSPNLKASIDTGHANLVSKFKVDEWIKAYSKHLHHMHIHNNFGDNDAHSSILNGTIDFKKVFDTLIETELKPMIIFEIFERTALLESLNYFNSYFEEKECLKK